MKILLTGDAISADEALRIGLINEIGPRERLMARALDLAARVAENGPPTPAKGRGLSWRSAGRTSREDREEGRGASALT